VPWTWLKAIALNESTLGTNPKVALGLKEPGNSASVSYDGLSWGLMQVRVETANDFIKGTTFKDLNDPQKAVKIAAMFIAWIMRQFPNDKGEDLKKKVFMSYNQGVGGTKKGYTGAAPYWDKSQKHLAMIAKRDQAVV
jgi:soluble lytic murein transglycosylase-like protein